MKINGNQIQACLLSMLPCLYSRRRAFLAMRQIGTIGVCCWLATTVSGWSANPPSPLAEPGPDALTNTLAQIAALQAETRALSPAQKKIATPLLDALREFRGDAPRPYAPKIRSNLRLRSGGRILVDIRGNVSASLLAYLQAQGAIVQSSYPQYRSIRADIPIAAVETMAAHADVKSVRPAAQPVANVGTATSEGDYAETVDQAQSNFGVNGSGVNVGVLSSSTLYLNNSQSSGDLGGVTVLPGQSGIGLGGSDEGEGTAMLEIVHDLAPGAQLYFATGFASESAMASNIIALADAGCSIIIDDVTYEDESPFHQNQPISQAVKTVSDRGVLYFSSAANSGNLIHGTAGTWTGNFITYGLDPHRVITGQLHDWGGTPYNQITLVNGDVTLFWSDPWGAATNDYDLFITDVNGNVVRSDINQFGQDTNNITGDPYEVVPTSTNSPEYVVVALASGTQRDIWVGAGRGQLAHKTAGNTRGHNAASAANAFCVAATTAKGFHSGLQFAGGAGNPVENFSSDGFPRLFFEADGSAVTPGDLTASGGRLLLKPDITAADGVTASTNTFGTNLLFTPFYGTSAAAPHAGAIAALIKSYRPDLTPQQIRMAMTNTALDIESPGFDADSGAGIVMANATMVSVDNTPPVVAVTSPPNNGAVNLLSSISGTASDIGSGLQGKQIHFTLNHNGNFWSGNYWTNTVATDPSILLTATVANGKWIFTNVPSGGNQVQGSYYISAFAQDNAGNVSQAQSGVTSTSFTISTTPPTVAITFPANGSTITNQLGGNWFQGTASGNLGISVSMSIFIRRNSDNLYWTGSGWGSVTNGYISNTYSSGAHTWQSTGPLPVPGSSLGNDTYHFIAIAVDAAGNQQEVDSLVSVDFHPIYVFNYGSQFGPTPNMNWSDPANWDVGSVPTPDAWVVINNYQPDSTGLGKFPLYRLDLSGGVLTTAGMLLQKLNLSGGTLAGGTITLATNGICNWTGGIFGSSLVVPTNGLVQLSGIDGADYYLFGVMTNAGTVQLVSGNLEPLGPCDGGAGLLVNLPGGLVDFQADVAIHNYCGSETFYNAGLVRKSGGTNTSSINAIFNNTGILEVQTGTMSVNGGGSSQGSFVADAGATLTYGGNYEVDGLLTGAGTNLLNGFVLSGSGVISNGLFVWSSGALGASSTLTVASNGVMQLAGVNGTDYYLAGVLTNAGKFQMVSGNLQILGSCDGGAGLMVNRPGGLVDLQADVAIHNYCGDETFTNAGIVRKSGGTGTSSITTAFNNGGTLEVQTGTISLNGGGSGSGLFAADSGATLAFGGGSYEVDSALGGGGNYWFTGGTTTLNGNLSSANGLLAGGALAGSPIISGKLNWTDGYFAAGSMITVASNGVVLLAGINGTDYNLLGQMTIAGTLRLDSGNLLIIGSCDGGDGQLLNLPGGLVDFQADVTIHSYCGDETFGNAGLVRKSGGTNSSSITTIFNNTGTLEVQTGTMSVNGGGSSQGNFVADTGATLTYGANYEVDGLLTGAGTNLLNGFTLSGTGVISNGLFVWRNGALGAASALTVAGNGVMQLAGVNGTDYPLLGMLTNAGTMQLVSGNLQLVGPCEGGVGLLVNRAGGLVDLQADVAIHNYCGGETFTNAGTVRKSGGAGTSSIATIFNNGGLLDVLTGTVTLNGGGSGHGVFESDPGATLAFGGGSYEVDSALAGSGNYWFTGATVTLNGNLSSANGVLAGGELTGSPVVSGKLIWTGGSLGVGSMITVASNGVVQLAGINGSDYYLFGMMTNAGTMRLVSGNLEIVGPCEGGSGQLSNLPGGLVDFQADVAIRGYCGSETFYNSGIVRKSGGTNTSAINAIFNNTGTLDLHSGTLGVNAAYTTASASRLQLSLGGLSAGTQYGNESFPGAADFNGTLSVVLTNSFAPTNGQSFVIATYTSSIGQFMTNQLPPLAYGSMWSVDYGAAALTLRVVPQAVLSNPKLTWNGHFLVTLAGPSASSAVLWASPDLITWSAIATNAPFTGSFIFDDPWASTFTKRFYRVLMQP